MPRCREVVRIVAGDGLADGIAGAGWMRRLAIRAHLMICRNCRHYAAELRGMGTAARETWAPGAEDDESIGRIDAAVSARIASLKDDPKNPAE